MKPPPRFRRPADPLFFLWTGFVGGFTTDLLVAGLEGGDLTFWHGVMVTIGLAVFFAGVVRAGHDSGRIAWKGER